MDLNNDRYRARSRLRKEQRTRQLRNYFIFFCVGLVALVLLIVLIANNLHSKRQRAMVATETEEEKYIADQPELEVLLIDYNDYSRPGIALEKVNGIVIHYTANPGTTAVQNRDYFAGLAQTGDTYASSHFIVGLDGEIVQCIPCNEISYASNDRNSDTLAIECCINDETGKFNEQTYSSLVKLTCWLMGRYKLSVDDVIRHYDITGKACPKYFVDHEDKWEAFKQDLTDYIEEYGVERETETQEN